MKVDNKSTEKKKNIYRLFCTGCGLCKSVEDVPFTKDEKGYEWPELDEKHISFCGRVCPSGGTALRDTAVDNIWGDYAATYLGWSLDEVVRTAASSGGILTSLCCYLIEKEIVDGIIHTKVDEESVYGTRTVISRSRDEVLSCMGSRYAISSPLSDIKQIVKPGERYAFIGKPCDVSALKMYLKEDAQLKKQIPYLFSFFCAGIPSDIAQVRLIQELGCTEDNPCTTLKYRGDGWPGYATAIDSNGESHSITYEQSWGKILGRDVRKSCRFCVDGIGEKADISCGDAWYLTENLQPDFTEHKGRNVIFARTELGRSLLEEVARENRIVIQGYEKEIKNLKYIQKYQYERKAAMGDMLLGMRLFRKEIPTYDSAILKSFAKELSVKYRFKRFRGVIKRILLKTI